jgi:hypothetical protein
MIYDLMLAAFMLFIIILPRFCFRVSDEDYEKFMMEHK